MASFGGRQTLVPGSHGRRDEDDSVPTHEQHGDVPLRGSVNLFVGLFVELNGRHGLLHITQDHVQVLVIGLESEERKEVSAVVNLLTNYRLQLCAGCYKKIRK